MNDTITPNKKEQFIIKINDMKQRMGLLYTLVAQRILPIVLFIIPINVVLEQTCLFINRHYPNSVITPTFFFIAWIVALLAFSAIAILTPKAATVVEFVIGFAYLFFAFRYHLFTNLLGYSLLIAMIIFLIVKLVFLVFKLIGLRVFADDKKNHIERDESGRVVRAVGEEVVFSTADIKDDIDAMPVVDDEFYFIKEDNRDEASEPVIAADDDFFFADNNSDEVNDAVPAADDDFFFG